MNPFIATAVSRANDQWNGPPWPWFPLIPFLFFGLWLTLWFAVGRRRWRNVPHRAGESVLSDRYARGEIDETEYRERRSVLRQK